MVCTAVWGILPKVGMATDRTRGSQRKESSFPLNLPVNSQEKTNRVSWYYKSIQNQVYRNSLKMVLVTAHL